MDTIKFKTRQTKEGPIVDIYINERNIIDILIEVESSFALREGKQHIAGDYSGLWPEIVYLPSKHMLGKPVEELDFYNGKSAILRCKCGITECWPFVVNIYLDKDTVTWSDFEQPHRGKNSAGGHWEYEQLNPFIFDRKQYEEALKHRLL
ncbi:hypothetical protein H1Z61_11865 [Bacillus aquiflavi]|uniref:Uncharacterized protein n=1 Tax=Bacillus aquiflavi TaxID=2672567 RepID=A0A6B3W264_9BACI|nr:hypothetical protein [Bacillus aquiflavi]MBA4537807.1 hypothetical protein [Bacillus aquiflavi]NEY82063.1 hypothetical protein [Bacillus aquiflavi]